MAPTRRNDVQALLRAAADQLLTIEGGYERALRDESLDLRVPVKNLMENLRSALDYMAHDIYESCCKAGRTASGRSDPKNIYFPYGQQEEDFRSGLGASLPGLQAAAPKVYDLLIAIQPFRCADSWLHDLCSILNTKKHDHLTPQVRQEAETHTVEGPAGSVMIPVNNPSIQVSSLPGTVQIFGVPAQFGSDGIRTAPSGRLRHIRTKWVAFVFEGTSVNVLGLLRRAVPSIRKLSEDVYRELGT